MSKLEFAAFGGKHSVSQILLEAFQDAEHLDNVAIIMQTKDGEWLISWSDQEASKLSFASHLLANEAMKVATEGVE